MRLQHKRVMPFDNEYFLVLKYADNIVSPPAI